MKLKHHRTFSPVSTGILAIMAAFGQLSNLSAASASWNVATGGDWAVDTNWTPAAAPGNTTSGATVNGDIATLNTAEGGIINIDAGRTFRGLNIGQTAGAYTFTGGPLYISRNASTGTSIQTLPTGGGVATQTIDAPIVITRVVPASGLGISNRYSGSTNLLNFTSAATITSQPLSGEEGPITINLRGANTGANTLGGVISDGTGTNILNIDKREAGTWVLNAANTYSGTTLVVDAGSRLLINGNQSGATGNVTVGSGATLGGAGTIGGLTHMNGGSILVVGASASTVGTLSFASALEMGGATTTLEIGGNVAGQFDRIDVTGALTYGGNLEIVDFMGYDISGQTAEYQLVGIGASQSGTLASVTVDSVALTGNSGVWTASAGNVTYSFDQSTGRLAVTMSSGTAFENWIGTNYPQIPNGSNGPNDDADNDGATNLSEFAFGGNPADGSDNGKLNVFKADSADNAKLVLTVSVRAGTPAFSTDDSPVASYDGILYSISGSLDLLSFATKVNPIAPVVPEGMPAAKAGYEYRSFSLEGSEGLPDKGFIRASVMETTN